MNRRARSLAVVAIVLGGAIGIVSSTQPWLEVTLAGGGHPTLAVPGAAAVAVLAPLSLAALALGLALSIVGVVLRYAFALVALAIGGALTVTAWRVGAQHPIDAVTATVTDATGLSGTRAMSDLVDTVSATVWPWLAVTAGVLIVAGGILTLTTAKSWRSTASRYRTTPTATAAVGARPYDAVNHDAIDSWDGLSRGDDPTA